MSSISVVMPAYNEEGIIERSVRNFYDEIVKKVGDSELIIVDDWSTDKTPIILKKLQKELPKLVVIKTPRNSGHGKAVRLGFKTAKKEFIFHTDSDYQHDPKEFWKLYTYIGNYDIVVGVRKKRQDPFYRKVISRISRFFGTLLFGVELHDMNCPFRIYKRETFNKLVKWLDDDMFAPSIMILLVSTYFGVEVKEVPVTHYPRETGKISILGWGLVKACFKSFGDMLVLRKKLFSKNRERNLDL